MPFWALLRQSLGCLFIITGRQDHCLPIPERLVDPRLVDPPRARRSARNLPAYWALYRALAIVAFCYILRVTLLAQGLC